MIKAENLVKYYPNGTLALKSFSVTVSPGEMVGLVGPSGAGKTTFLRMLNASLRPTSGELDVLGHSINQINGSHLRSLRHRLSYIPQNYYVLPVLSVLHNVLMGRLGHLSTIKSLLALVRIPQGELERAYEALAKVGLEDKAESRASELSGGQQQRAALARALVQDAEVIAADEPVASVDIATAEGIMQLLQKLNREEGKTIIVSLHQIDLAREFCPRLIGISSGRLVYDGPPPGLTKEMIYSFSNNHESQPAHS